MKYLLRVCKSEWPPEVDFRMTALIEILDLTVGGSRDSSMSNCPDSVIFRKSITLTENIPSPQSKIRYTWCRYKIEWWTKQLIPHREPFDCPINSSIATTNQSFDCFQSWLNHRLCFLYVWSTRNLSYDSIICLQAIMNCLAIVACQTIWNKLQTSFCYFVVVNNLERIFYPWVNLQSLDRPLKKIWTF